MTQPTTPSSTPPLPADDAAAAPASFCRRPPHLPRPGLSCRRPQAATAAAAAAISAAAAAAAAAEERSDSAASTDTFRTAVESPVQDAPAAAPAEDAAAAPEPTVEPAPTAAVPTPEDAINAAVETPRALKPNVFPSEEEAQAIQLGAVEFIRKDRIQNKISLDNPITQKEVADALAALRNLAFGPDARVTAEQMRARFRAVPSASNVPVSQTFVKINGRTFRITVTVPLQGEKPVALLPHQWDDLKGSFSTLIQQCHPGAGRLPKKAQYDLFGDTIEVTEGNAAPREIALAPSSLLKGISDTLCAEFEHATPLPEPAVTPAAQADQEKGETPEAPQAAGSTPSAPRTQPELSVGPFLSEVAREIRNASADLREDHLAAALRVVSLQSDNKFHVVLKSVHGVEQVYTYRGDNTGTVKTLVEHLPQLLQKHGNLVIPLHQGGHWTALFVKGKPSGWRNFLKRPVLEYYNPYPHGEIPEELEGTLQNIARTLGATLILNPTSRLCQMQGHDRHRCGAFVVGQAVRTFIDPHQSDALAAPHSDADLYDQEASSLTDALSERITSHRTRLGSLKNEKPLADEPWDKFQPAPEKRSTTLHVALSALTTFKLLERTRNPLFIALPSSHSATAFEIATRSSLATVKEKADKYFPEVPLIYGPDTEAYAPVEGTPRKVNAYFAQFPKLTFDGIALSAPSQAALRTTVQRILEVAARKQMQELILEIPPLTAETPQEQKNKQMAIGSFICAEVQNFLSQPRFASSYTPVVRVVIPDSVLAHAEINRLAAAERAAAKAPIPTRRLSALRPPAAEAPRPIPRSRSSRSRRA